MSPNFDVLLEAAENIPSMSQQSGQQSKKADESSAASTAADDLSASTRGESPGPIKPSFPSHKIKKHVLATLVKIPASKTSAEGFKKIIKNANENIKSLTSSYTDLHDHATASLEKGKRVHDSTFHSYKSSVSKCNKERTSCNRLKKELSDRTKRVNSLKTEVKNLKKKGNDQAKDHVALRKKHQKMVEQTSKLRHAHAKAPQRPRRQAPECHE